MLRTNAITISAWSATASRRFKRPVLSADEIERYARHIVMREVGGPGQAALKEARVLVIGAGGLGAPVLMYLAAAGVGTLGVVDDDTVSLSNLQRQMIHATPDIGRSQGRHRRRSHQRAQPPCHGSPRTSRGSMPPTRWR